MVFTVVQQTEKKTIHRRMEHYAMDQLLSWEVHVVKMMNIINVHRRHAISMVKLQLQFQLQRKQFPV